MIIFGTRGRNSVHQSGEFYCPSCEVEREYEWTQVKNWFTLYFIPLIPLGLQGEYVECTVCLRTYEVEILEQLAEIEGENKEFLSNFQKAIRDVMIMMMLADGVIAEEEEAAIRSAYSSLSGSEYSVEELKTDVARVEHDSPDLLGYLKGVAGSLNDEGKKIVLESAIYVALSEGELQQEERGLLKSIAKILDISESSIDRICVDIDAQDS